MEFRVGLPTDGKKRWRCDICSLLNMWENNECKRCKEPIDEERKRKLYLKPRKIQGTTPRFVNNNNSNSNKFNNNNNRFNRNVNARSKPAISKNNNNRRVSKTNNKNNNVQIYEFNKSKKNENSSNGKQRKTYGFNKNGNIKKVKTTKKESYKPLRKENLSEKHLGYKSSKKRVNTYVRSKLNHDTAAYRAKFSNKENKNSLSHKISGMKKGVPVYTMNDLTKNGFQTRIDHPNKTGKLPIKKNNNTTNNYHNKSKYNYDKKRQQINKKIVSLHDERPVTPPPKKAKGAKGQKKRSLIDMLQKECSGEIMANLRQGGRYIRKEKKNMEGGRSKYDL